MKVHLNDIIEELYKSKDWGMEYDDFKEICRVPLDFLKNVFHDATPKKVRFKHFGSFEPMEFRYIERIERTIVALSQGSDHHFKYKIKEAEHLINYLTDEYKRKYQRELSRAIEDYHIHKRGSG